MRFDEFLDAVAAKQPTPGGGAVASTVGALAAALAQMVINYSIGKRNLAEHEPDLQSAWRQLERARQALLELAEEDAAAYGVVNQLMKLPPDDARRKRDLPAAVELATQAPLSTTAGAVAMLRLFESLTRITNPILKSDLAIAAILAEATARASAQNVLVNLPTLHDVSGRARMREFKSQLDAVLKDAATLQARVLKACV